jgi:hypothetical protein
MQRCSIWTVSLAAALSLTGAAWAEHGEGGGHGPGRGHGTTPTFAKQRGSDEAHEARESHSGAQNSGNRSAAGANFAARLTARVAKDPTLAAALKNLGVSDVATAAKGFRNLNQFLTALNAAQDLHLDFGKLQMDMAGGDSLAQAILVQQKTLDPTALKTAIMMARNETKTELKAVRAGEEAAEDAKEAAKEAAEDAKEATKEAAEEANEAAKAPTGTTATGSSPTPSSVTKP